MSIVRSIVRWLGSIASKHSSRDLVASAPPESSRLIVRDGILHSPYFIFVKSQPLLSDEALLAHFGLSDFRRMNVAARNSRYVVVADAGDWKMLADSWLYHLWNRSNKFERLAALARTHDRVFACSCGDCDHSYDFCFYQAGTLIRRLVIESPGYDDRVVVESVGEPFDAEPDPEDDKPVQPAELLAFAATFGIKTRFNSSELRIFNSPHDVGPSQSS